jgi:hypothetical protein
LPVLDPLDENERIRILDQILDATPIKNPKKAFTLYFKESSLACLDKQV